MQRRLAAVMIADVCGYGLLSQADEEGTRLRFQADLNDIFLGAIAAHSGRLVKTMGDGLLIEFHSIVEAVRCAVDVQQLKSVQRKVGTQHLEFRIGINLGDVIVEGDDINGDGVNIAERLQSLAEPGGIVISGTAYDHVEKHLAVAFEYLGERNLKHVLKPIRTYRLILDKSPQKTVAKIPIRLNYALAAGIIALLAGAGTFWWSPWKELAAARGIEQLPLSLPDKPSIAVLPFNNVSDDPKQEYFADGMTDGLIAELAQISGLFVIARTSSFSYKGKSVPLRQVSTELGVRYVLEGSVQRAGEQLRITAKLLDALDGGHVWAGKFDGNRSDVFALQDEVTSGIADALTVRLVSDQKKQSRGDRTGVPDALDAYLRGWESQRRATPEDLARSISFFEQAISLDPEYERAYAAAAMAYARIYRWRWHSLIGLSRPEARSRAAGYLQSAPTRRTALTYQAAGLLSESDWQHSTALEELREAIALEPGDPWNYALTALVLTSAGRPEEAIPHIQRALRLDPQGPPFFSYVLGLMEFSMGNFDAAAEAAEESLRSNPGDDNALLLLAASYGQLGRRRDAEAAIKRYNQLRTGRGGIIAAITTCPPLDFARAEDSERLYRGLRLAGVPETLPEVQEDVIMTTQEALPLFLGRRLRGTDINSGSIHEATISPAGRASLSGGWVTDERDEMTSAEVRLVGDQVCFYDQSNWTCGRVLRNPGGIRNKENEYIWYAPGRTLTFSSFD